MPMPSPLSPLYHTFIHALPQVVLECLNQSPSHPFKESDKLAARVVLLTATKDGSQQAACAELLTKCKVGCKRMCCTTLTFHSIQSTSISFAYMQKNGLLCWPLNLKS